MPILLLLLAAQIGPTNSAEACGRCHRAIHLAWKSSAHARSMESRLFQDVLELTGKEYGAAARKACLACHAPVAVQTGDLSLQSKTSWEGVTCDYCHSIREVSLAGGNPKARMEYGSAKSGPLKDSSSSAHATVYSEVHTSSLACAPCHEYRNPFGFPILTTFTEWKESKYAAEGRQCQSCHMSRVAGDVVEPRLQRSSVAKINLHQMPGSHSIDQLASTVKAQLSAKHELDHLTVSIEVTNAAAGHYVPTGSPLRQLVLEVRADPYDGSHFREQRVWRRAVADQDGNPVENEPAAFMKARKVIEDTRLAPGEKRTETFTFPVKAGVQTQVKATFWYYYSPLAVAESEKRVTFLTINRLVH